MSTVSISILALATRLCGPTNENLCHNNLMRCFDHKKTEELIYAEGLVKRSNINYPERNLVLECALDQGLDIDQELVNTDQSPVDSEPSLETPPTAPIPDKYGMVWDDEIPGKMEI